MTTNLSRSALADPFVRPDIGDAEFRALQLFLARSAGIHLSDAKKALVIGRLNRRLQACALASYRDYIDLIARDPVEAQTAVDLLTTNETYFFREPRHFDFLRETVLPAVRPGQTFRVWSAASSTGEEPYSIAMTLAATLGEGPWEVLGTDISTRVLEQCRSGRYALERADDVPLAYLRAYCLRGTGPEQGHFLIDRTLRRRVHFQQANLNAPLPPVGAFNVIFLRNVMIYFQTQTKRQLVARLLEHLRPGGWLFVGHAETLNGLNERVEQVRPAIYRKP